MIKIKVFVVDDSAFMRKILTDVINSPNMEVIGTAKNGEEAIKKIKELKPDVVTLDVEMPIMDGLTALKNLMKDNPVPIIMLSSYTKDGAEATFKALELGAIDFISKPSSVFKVNTADVISELREKIEIASKVKLKKADISVIERKDETISSNKIFASKIDKIVAIGTSTGGPKALQEVIPKMPKDINASLIIVQHMPPKFTKSLADRLDTLSSINVKEAEDGDVLKPGWAYIAPGNRHLKLKMIGKNYIIKLTIDDLVSGHRPSADAMFNSVADLKIKNVIGVIMTGMGSDGAKGLARIKKENNGYIIAQDESSCVVFGMPKSAIEKNVVDKICDLKQISSEIIKALGV